MSAPTIEPRLIQAIISLHADLGYPPTQDEIAVELGICQRRVWVVLHRLKERGVVDWIPRRPRTIHVVKGWEV